MAKETLHNYAIRDTITYERIFYVRAACEQDAIDEILTGRSGAGYQEEISSGPCDVIMIDGKRVEDAGDAVACGPFDH